MDRYLRLVCKIPLRQEGQLAELLDTFSVLGCSIDEGDDEATITVFLQGGMAGEARGLAVAVEELGADEITVSSVENQDWFAAYRKKAKPFAVGSGWWIDPDPEGQEPPPSGRIRLGIEPSDAFGSGTHESTRLVLQALEEMPVSGASILDVGTGSGILALAGDALGAEYVVGLDVDPRAVWTARRTARRQDWRARPVFLVAPVEAIGAAKFDIILCNMIATEFVPILHQLGRLLSAEGQLVLSGVLEDERNLVTSVVEESALRTIAERHLGEWMSVRAVHG
jgi:ribosomal protein L11 methyltransferase